MKYAEIIQSALCRVNLPGISRPKPSLFFYPGLNSKHIHHYNPTSDTAQIKPEVVATTENHSSSLSPYSSSLSKISNTLQQNYETILSEYKELRKVQSSDYKLLTDEHKLHQGGSWEWNSYILKGRRQSQFVAICPQTVTILESFQSPSLMTNVPFSYAFYSTLGKNTNIASHYGPCNLRLRCHFPLLVPVTSSTSHKTLISNSQAENNIENDEISTSDSKIVGVDKSGCGMQIAGQTVRWHEGEAIFFDDTYEHSVWNNTAQDRVVLLFDIWHPDLTEIEIAAISDMFRYAQDKGWLADNK